MNWTVVASLAGVIVAPLLTYLVAIRRSSGRINTTEAATLWVEAEKMRTAYKEEAKKWREETNLFRAEAAICKSQLATLTEQMKELRGDK